MADTPPAPAPAAGDPIADWMAESPATNAGYAQWIVDGVTHGFVVWTGKDSKKQMEKLAANEKVGSTEPSKATVLGALNIIRTLISFNTSKYSSYNTKPNQTLCVHSFIRGASPHDGRAIDINQLDWTGANGPVQVEEALRALPEGAYGIGLPFQGQFFPKAEWLDERKRMLPNIHPPTSPSSSLQKCLFTRYTSSYNYFK